MDIKDYLQDILNPDSDMTTVLSSLMCIVEDKNAVTGVRELAFNQGICPDCWEEMQRLKKKFCNDWYWCKCCDNAWEVER